MSAVAAGSIGSSHGRVALALGVAGALAIVALFPYAIELVPPDKLAQLPPLPVVVVMQTLQAGVLFTLLAWIGLKLGAPLGLDAPRVRALLEQRAVPPLPWRAIALGAVVAVLAVVAIAGAARQLVPQLAAADTPSPAAWKGLLASFYGGIAEELQLRLFLMTLIAWALLRIPQLRLSAGVAFAVANVLAAIAFGAAHLPAAAQLFTLTAGVVAYIVSANAAAGLVFGALYARHGLEAAMAAHFIADIGLHVVVPLVQGTG